MNKIRFDSLSTRTSPKFLGHIYVDTGIAARANIYTSAYTLIALEKTEMGFTSISFLQQLRKYGRVFSSY